MSNSTRRIMPNPFPGMIAPQSPSVLKVTGNGEQAGTKGTLIAMVLDESGSMGSVVDQTIEGYNQYIGDQRKNNPNDTYVTLCKFEGGNTRYPYTNSPILNVPALSRLTFTPAGGTNLLDAIGKTILDTDAHLVKLELAERPSVVITIFTDGHENASREFTNESIKQMVKDREAKGWAFMFLGANIDAFAVGSQFGMGFANTASYSMNNMAATMSVASATTTRMRGAQAKGLATEAVYESSGYTSAERDAIKK